MLACSGKSNPQHASINVIDLKREKALGLDEISKHLPASRGARKVSFTTVLRWIQKGARAADGRLVRLEALRLGSRWVSSLEAVQRFAENLASTPDDATPACTPRGPGRIRRGAGKAGELLVREGI
jgi:hypothetical protein